MEESHSSAKATFESQQENQQQFCLKWHNHQTSLLSTLPLLLDQSHLTDVTISAEGRSVQAHRIVLSACSSFFSELFRTLDAKNHPIIIIPGATFGAIVALITFMYSGEVNVYEEQIPMVLSLAETLGIKGLAEVHDNIQKIRRPSEQEFKEKPPLSSQPSSESPLTTSMGSSTPQQTELATSPYPINFPLLTNYIPLEFLKSLQMSSQALNLSEDTLIKTSDLLQKYQKCNGYIDSSFFPHLKNKDYPNCKLEDVFEAKRVCFDNNNSQKVSDEINQHQFQSTAKHFDKIVETLRAKKNQLFPIDHSIQSLTKGPTCQSVVTKNALSMYPIDFTNSIPSQISAQKLIDYVKAAQTGEKAKSRNLCSEQEEHKKVGDISVDKYSCAITTPSNSAAQVGLDFLKEENEATSIAKTNLMTAIHQGKPPSHSKLYATCFICHKQLSNQYNLRVHMETHQNVRYSCSVCSHVSRSKDALRKHISYRHPSTQPLGESDSRRKRSFKACANSVLPFLSNNQDTSSSTDLSSSISSMQNDNLNSIHTSQMSSSYMRLSNQYNLDSPSLLDKKHQQSLSLSFVKPEEDSASSPPTPAAEPSGLSLNTFSKKRSISSDAEFQNTETKPNITNELSTKDSKLQNVEDESLVSTKSS